MKNTSDAIENKIIKADDEYNEQNKDQDSLIFQQKTLDEKIS